MSDFSHLTLQTRELYVHALTLGNPADPLVLLLHGFPELAASWQDVMPYLADAGFYVVAPDLRGYGGTTKPERGYDLDTLARDVVELISALGRERASLVGHDWGGAIAYHVAAMHPGRVERLAVVNCPHPAVMARRMWRPDQLRRSWYFFFFQLPVLPERVLTRRGGALIPRVLRRAAVDKRRFTDERLRPFAENMAEPEVARAGLAYYRQAFRGALSARGLRRLFFGYPKIKAPFRLVWAEADVALGKHLTTGMDDLFEQPVDVQYLPNVGHFSPIEAPDKVGPLVAAHLQG